jgi:hypothetical protein
MKIYYCQCGGKIEVLNRVGEKCKCGKLFGKTGKISDYINMRNTLSGTTKMEFNETTMEESAESMRKS